VTRHDSEKRHPDTYGSDHEEPVIWHEDQKQKLTEVPQTLTSGICDSKRKVKVRLSLCLTKYYAMKTWRSGGIAPRITNLGISYRSVVSFTSQPLFTPGERVPDTHWIGGWVSPKAGLDGMTNFFFNIWRILLCFIWHKCDNNVIIIITTGSRQIRLGEAETKSR